MSSVSLNLRFYSQKTYENGQAFFEVFKIKEINSGWWIIIIIIIIQILP